MKLDIVKLKEALRQKQMSDTSRPVKTLPTVNVGREPIYVENSNDPRLRAYQDSLSLYNKGLKPFLDFNPYGEKMMYQKKDYKPNKNWGKTKVKKSDIINDIREIKDQLNYEENPEVSKNLNDRMALLNKSLKTGIYPTNMIYPETASGALIYKKPVQPVEYRKPQSKKEESKKEQPSKKETKTVEKKQNTYVGNPVYSSVVGTGMPSALIGFTNKSGDTTYISPEDYQRFAVTKEAQRIIESKKKGK